MAVLNDKCNYMKIERKLTADAMIHELVRRIVQRRVDLGLTQIDTAEQAGISLRTLKRFESGNDCQLSTFVRLLQTFNLIDLLDQLIPDSSVTPMETLKRQTKPRRRASSPKKIKPTKPWKWGDQQ